MIRNQKIRKQYFVPLPNLKHLSQTFFYLFWLLL